MEDDDEEELSDEYLIVKAREETKQLMIVWMGLVFLSMIAGASFIIYNKW